MDIAVLWLSFALLVAVAFTALQNDVSGRTFARRMAIAFVLTPFLFVLTLAFIGAMYFLLPISF